MLPGLEKRFDTTLAQARAYIEQQEATKERLKQVAAIRPHLGAYDGEAWAEWLVSLFLPWFLDKSGRFTSFASFHAEFWRHIFSIKAEVAPDPFVEIVARDGGKSTNAEMAFVYVGGEDLRGYGWYISGTQTQADDHVSNISTLMQSRTVAARYPHLGKVALDTNGRSLGWRASRLSTSPKDPKGESQRGFTVDAVGLDKAVRGGRLEERRPDFIMIDDIDDEQDTVRAVEKKIKRLSQTILPAGASNVAVVFVQNMPNAHGVAARLVDNSAGILTNRKLSGPHPAVKDLSYVEDRKSGTVTITGGTPTWAGFSIPRVQEIVNRVGLNSLLVEYQHERHLSAGIFLSGIWHESIHAIPPFAVPESWRIDRSFDWGSAKPYGIVWWAESDGETPIEWHTGKLRRFPKGTLFAIRELYGWDGRPNVGVRHSASKIAELIREVEKKAYWGARVKKGPADASIYDAEDDETESIADRMKAAGVEWVSANKSPGSRVAGAEKIVEMLRASLQHPMEGPGFYVTTDCPQMIRTFPVLPKDPTNPDDVDTESEDHLWDLTRYRVLRKRRESGGLRALGNVMPS